MKNIVSAIIVLAFFLAVPAAVLASPDAVVGKVASSLTKKGDQETSYVVWDRNTGEYVEVFTKDKNIKDSMNSAISGKTCTTVYLVYDPKKKNEIQWVIVETPIKTD
jgi:predicted dinucleotide-utilizing enzyme